MAVSEGALLAGRYRVVGRLGSGGMGTVYLAEDERLGRQVAVKRLHAESPEDLALRFQREAELGASLNHPNVVAVYDAAPDDYGVLIVMEYVEGRTLADAIRAGDLSEAGRRRVLAETAVALDHAHSVGVVHRDVKPANVLLRPDGVVKLTDLGIATAAEREQITRTGALLGTPSYMAPEQLEGGPTGPAADVYALAAVAFEVLSGRKAVIGRSPVEIAHRVVAEPPSDLRSAWPEAPEPAAAVLMRGMAKAPAERPQSAGALVGELVEALGPEGEGALDTRPAPAAPVEEDRTYVEEEATGVDATRFKPGPSRTGRRRPRAALAGWAAGIVLLLGAAAAIALSSSGSEPTADRPRSTPRAPAPPPAAPPVGPRTPEQTVGDFYLLTVKKEFEAAWKLTGPGWRTQLQGYEGYKNTFDTLRDVEFSRLETVEEGRRSATVAIRTIARHTNRTDRCEGTFSLSRKGRAWLIARGGVQCSTRQRAGAA